MRDRGAAVRVTRASLRRLDACDAGARLVGRLLPTTVHRDPERNLPLAMRLVQLDAPTSTTVMLYVDWLVARISGRLEYDSDLAYQQATMQECDVSLLAQMLAMLAD